MDNRTSRHSSGNAAIEAVELLSEFLALGEKYRTSEGCFGPIRANDYYDYYHPFINAEINWTELEVLFDRAERFLEKHCERQWIFKST